jgi:hypothetical protein
MDQCSYDHKTMTTSQCNKLFIAVTYGHNKISSSSNSVQTCMHCLAYPGSIYLVRVVIYSCKMLITLTPGVK